jgi:metal-responsive CopG/Arc/MetJ family transcriptional regulator
MSTTKIAITIEHSLLERLDHVVQRYGWPSRSKAIQEAVVEKLERLDRSRLARECAKLDRREEQGIAEEGIAYECESWPEY